MKILAQAAAGAAVEGLAAAATQLGAELITVEPGMNGSESPLYGGLRAHPDLVFVPAGTLAELQELRAATRARGAALAVACTSPEEALRAAIAGADEWTLPSATPSELATRLQSAMERARRSSLPAAAAEVAEHLQYEELLYDRFTGFPTLPLMLERAREMLERSGR
nr:hypothetical protein [Gemmatimonadota bacterium]